MVTDVYADLLFLINFSMDYLCLYICARVLHRKMSLVKSVVSASVGGIYSVISLILSLEGILSLIIDGAICVVMCAIVFAEKGRRASSTLLCSFLFVGISMMTGGAMTAIFNLLNRLNLPIAAAGDDGISPYIFAILAIASGIITLKSGKILSKRSTITTCTIRVRIKQNEASFKALSDSGNLARDPLGGKPIIILDKNIFSKIADMTFFDELASGNTPQSIPYRSARIIPVKTAAGTSLLIAIAPDKLTVEVYDRRKDRTLSTELDALIAPSDIGDIGDGCNAIIPAEILKF